MNLVNAESNKADHLSMNENDMNTRLLWLQICLNVFPMWIPKCCYFMDFIIILCIVVLLLGISGYYTFITYQQYPDVLFTIWFNSEVYFDFVSKVLSLYYYGKKFDKWYYNIQKSRAFQTLSFNIIGFRYSHIYWQMTIFMMISVFVESIQLGALIYYDSYIESHTEYWIIFRYIFHVLQRIMTVFPMGLTICIYSVFCYQYQIILKKISKQLNDNNSNDYGIILNDYKVIYQRM